MARIDIAKIMINIIDETVLKLPFEVTSSIIAPKPIGNAIENTVLTIALINVSINNSFRAL